MEIRAKIRPRWLIRWLISGLLGTMVLLGATQCWAQQPSSPKQDRFSSNRLHTMAEVGLGFLSLPRASLCLPSEPSCTTTDMTLLLALRQLVQWNQHWAVGAGVSWGLSPRSEKQSTPSPDGPLERNHDRNYFMLAPRVRYFLSNNRPVEFWLSGTAGVVIVSDRYKPLSPSGSLIGPKAITVGKEGALMGVGFGGKYNWSREWSIGAWTTQMLWLFPNDRRCAPTGDCSTVQGNLFSFEMGINISYRIWL